MNEVISPDLGEINKGQVFQKNIIVICFRQVDEGNKDPQKKVTEEVPTLRGGWRDPLLS